jgi:hypothetical protein
MLLLQLRTRILTHRDSSDIDINWRDGILCLQDPHVGPTLFHLANKVKFLTLKVQQTQAYPRPGQVSFGEHGAIVAVGSDHATIYIFDVSTGEKAQMLHVGGQSQGGRPQTVVVCVRVMGWWCY